MEGGSARSKRDGAKGQEVWRLGEEWWRLGEGKGKGGVWPRVKGEGVAWALGPFWGASPPIGPLMAGHQAALAWARGPSSKISPND